MSLGNKQELFYVEVHNCNFFMSKCNSGQKLSHIRWTQSFTAAVAAAVKKDCWVGLQDLVSPKDVLFAIKRPLVMARDGWLHWDLVPIYSDVFVKNCMAARGGQMLYDGVFLSDRGPLDFFRFFRTKKGLTGRHKSQEAFKTSLGGVCRSLTAADNAAAVHRKV